MSRSGYVDDCDLDVLEAGRWRGAVASAIRGRRGQAFLREMLVCLDALPKKELIAGELIEEGSVCALGAVGLARGISMEGIDPEDRGGIAAVFGIAEALAAELMYDNDEGGGYLVEETPEARFVRMRRWIEGMIKS